MKKLTQLMAVASLAVTLNSQAANTASDNATNSAYSGGNWTTSTNGGTGFSNWSFSTSGAGGKYIGSTALGATTFGIYSGGSGGSDLSSADRAFTGGALSTGQTFSITLANTSTVSGELGVVLLDGSTAKIVIKYVQFASSWKMWDGGTDFSISQGFAANTPLTFSLTYNGGTNYSYSFGSASGNNTATSGITNLTGFRVYDNNQGGSQNVGFNNLSVVHEPGTFALLGLGAAAISIFARRRRH